MTTVGVGVGTNTTAGANTKAGASGAAAAGKIFRVPGKLAPAGRILPGLGRRSSILVLVALTAPNIA